GRARQAGEYRRRCTTLGRQVRVETATGSFTGLACDLTSEGNLVVDHAGRRRTVGAADVVHLRPLG
ncbi:MAG TPA: hypothetical protein VKY15_08050, partial [Acidimicrobiales bacterium]|nr:hypothetical protein [Acidimicrobiales bacterium]